MTARSPMILGLAALLATALSAMGSLPPNAERAPIRGVADGPFRCALSLAPQGGGTAAAARLTASEAISGTYALALRAGGSAVDQGGGFEAAAGETVTLSEAILPGRRSALRGTLTVTAAGRSVACPTVEE